VNRKKKRKREPGGKRGGKKMRVAMDITHSTERQRIGGRAWERWKTKKGGTVRLRRETENLVGKQTKTKEKRLSRKAGSISQKAEGGKKSRGVKKKEVVIATLVEGKKKKMPTEGG